MTAVGARGGAETAYCKVICVDAYQLKITSPQSENSMRFPYRYL